jgi:N-sulfoglucosamine sulfohydrolase
MNSTTSAPTRSASTTWPNDLTHHAKVDELRERMMTMLVEEQDPRALGNAAIFDTYKYVGSRKKGYETWLAEKLKTAPDILEVKPANEKRRAEARGGK